MNERRRRVAGGWWVGGRPAGSNFLPFQLNWLRRMVIKGGASGMCGGSRGAVTWPPAGSDELTPVWRRRRRRRRRRRWRQTELGETSILQVRNECFLPSAVSNPPTCLSWAGCHGHRLAPPTWVGWGFFSFGFGCFQRWKDPINLIWSGPFLHSRGLRHFFNKVLFSECRNFVLIGAGFSWFGCLMVGWIADWRPVNPSRQLQRFSNLQL